MSRQDFGPYPAEAIGPLIEAMDALGATMPPGAVKAAQALRTLERTGTIGDAHGAFVADLSARAATAAVNGRPFNYAEEYLRGVPPLFDSGQLRSDRLTVLAHARNAVSGEFLGSLSAEVARLHVQGCDSVRQHVGLIPVLAQVDPFNPPKEAGDAKMATEHLRAVIAVTAIALKASGATRMKGNGVACYLGPATRAHPVRTPAPVSPVDRVIEVLEAVAAGPTWDEDELIDELMTINRTGEPTDGWADVTYLEEAVPA